jgi:hypothetical protein
MLVKYPGKSEFLSTPHDRHAGKRVSPAQPAGTAKRVLCYFATVAAAASDARTNFSNSS